MNVHELPMILFTVIAQMCVGMFIILGVVELWLSAKADEKTTDRLVAPIVYVIGPAMVFGLIASMFHMNDVTNTLNVIRNVGSSWLSREIVFGVGFAGFGFLYAILQWFRVGGKTLRRACALVTALFGIGLVWSMAMIYASLVTVPAWHTWVVPFQFFATALALGASAVAASIVVMTRIRQRSSAVAVGTSQRKAATQKDSAGGWRQRLGFDRNVASMNAPATDGEWAASVKIVRACAAVAAIVAVAIFISYIVHIQNLALHPEPAAATSLAVFTGGFFWARLILLGIGAVAVSFVAYHLASEEGLNRSGTLAAVVVTAFVLILIAEFMGRSLHYDSIQLVGIG
ncbi:anaerobic dimethyl sulfoxide reductase subunit C (anchor subunit) [Trueperella bonasi]|uniref:Anaerobic dimethyl sulfoxide reductase subunit C (Anchor subunit) n=1 Tax=Trueperella bonasi TaxID=312286 RepID=A0ABT9NGN2_9ACTO|nr:DmsC/YnfH family molybdoenzyme membrane anchor subunit [Trueperella bonasi]MDP9806530.1 anaerobic dimethyl sulfoxide reductase subunit C (anchor subunit) [Trueperella bonasi]